LVLMLFVAAKVGLRALGLRRLLMAIGLWQRRLQSTAVDQSTTVHLLERAVSQVAALLPGRALCLEQSLVLYAAMTILRIPTAFRMGVRAYGFRAHAWVEYRGMPIAERAEELRELVVFNSIG